MSDPIDRLATIVCEMRRLGVTKFRADDIEIELGPAPGEPVDEKVQAEGFARNIESARLRKLHTMFGASGVRPATKL